MNNKSSSDFIFRKNIFKDSFLPDLEKLKKLRGFTSSVTFQLKLKLFDDKWTVEKGECANLHECNLKGYRYS